jgi:hypothetical protein
MSLKTRRSKSRLQETQDERIQPQEMRDVRVAKVSFQIGAFPVTDPELVNQPSIPKLD